jgi:hypothetical protein
MHMRVNYTRQLVIFTRLRGEFFRHMCQFLSVDLRVDTSFITVYACLDVFVFIYMIICKFINLLAASFFTQKS